MRRLPMLMATGSVVLAGLVDVWARFTRLYTAFAFVPLHTQMATKSVLLAGCGNVCARLSRLYATFAYADVRRK